MFEFLILAALIALIAWQCTDYSPVYALSNGMKWEEEAEETPEWEESLMFKKGGGSAPSPDPRIGEAAIANTELGKEWLGFAREQFAEASERQEGIDELSGRLGEQQFAAGERAMDWSQEDRQRYKDKFLPLEDEFIAQATDWGSEASQEKVAAEARADVMKSAEMQRQQRGRNMSRMGIDPRSGRYAAIEKAGDVSTQLAAAGAVNRARDIRRKEGMAMKSDAINLGRGLPSQAVSGAGLGLNAGNAALNSNLSAAANQRANQSVMSQGFQGAMGANSSSANILTNLHGAEMNQWQANQQASQAPINSLMQAAGTGVGIWAGMGSSKELKKNKTPIKGALKAVKEMPVEAWNYKEGAKHPQTGEILDSTARHIGPYAEDFKEQTGQGDGRTIDIISAIGITMKAVQELDDKLDTLRGATK